MKTVLLSVHGSHKAQESWTVQMLLQSLGYDVVLLIARILISLSVSLCSVDVLCL
jgi:hypothetical protein